MLHGEKQRRPFPPDYLHALAPHVPALDMPLPVVEEPALANDWVWRFEFD